MSKKSPAQVVAPTAALFALNLEDDKTAKLVAKAQEGINETRQLERAEKGDYWKATSKQPISALNTRAVVIATLLELGAEFTKEQAIAALLPLQKSGALGSGSKAAGYFNWCVRVKHVVLAA